MAFFRRPTHSLTTSRASQMATELSNREIVVYALYLLGGATKRQHTEDIALKCFEVMPSAFSWVKHIQFPDKDIVRVALTDAHKVKFGVHVEGRTGQSRGQYRSRNQRPSSDGWILTDAGFKWVEENLPRLKQIGEVTRDHRQQSLKFLRRVRQHEAFKSFEASGDEFSPSIGVLAELLRCRVDADPDIWDERFDRISKNAKFANQVDILAFVERSKAAYRAQR